MRQLGPLLTLGAVAVLGAALFTAGALADPARQAAPVAAAAESPPAESPPAESPPPETPPPDPAAAEPPAAVPSPAVVEAVWAGRSSGNEVTVAVAVRDGRAVAYVCDGEQVEAWLEGALTGGSLALTGADAVLDATVDDASALGSVTVGGVSWPFSAQVVQAPDGLYDGRANVDGVAVRIGWIALDGTVTGGARADGEVVDAPAFDPIAPAATSLDGSPVTVTPVDGSSTGVAS